MNKFISSIIKFAVVCYATIIVFLVGFVTFLITAPTLLIKITYVLLLAVCMIAIIYLLVGLIGGILICNITKKKLDKSVKKK